MAAAAAAGRQIRLARRRACEARRRDGSAISTWCSGWRRESSAAPTSSSPPTISRPPKRPAAGWDPRFWTVDEAARILALLEFAAAGAPFAEAFGELCRTAEVGEAVALYRGLPLYPEPAALEWQVGEGLRTSMRAIFEAIAHRSPFPKENFSEDRWNHMVLKALFIGSTLAPIQGLDERANPTLAKILSDYAHERWAAGRPVTPELWRCLGPFAEGILLDDLEKLAASKRRRTSGAPPRWRSPRAPTAAPPAVLERLPDEARLVKAGSLSWESLGA